MVEELEINSTKNIVTLEQAVTEGKDALIPFEFEYPNSDLIVEVKIKPLTTEESQDAGQLAKTSGLPVDIELLKKSVFNPDGSSISEEILEPLPAGVVNKLVLKVAEVSGIEFNTPAMNNMDALQGF
ncbi:hypothetical protein [uncultured Methanobrevibacter sp.]|uniref:hypothetical protein n=1 Tax=uncultured Methanobrevibacter sp. TaxID=253161 RepID=UPI0025EA7879|nr:hypothetical protein [uncultured Methanobrevibacter sp.]